MMSLCPGTVRCSGSRRPRRSRWSSSIRARMTAKSSAARIAIFLPQFMALTHAIGPGFGAPGRATLSEIYHDQPALIENRGCGRDGGELWSPLLNVFARRGKEEGAASMPVAPLLHQARSAGGVSAGQCRTVML